MFARILPSNTEVDVGRGNSTVDVYHTRIPRGGGHVRVQENGRQIAEAKEKCNTSSATSGISSVAPHCLVIAMKV